MLADLGADVIKVERPGIGDDTRSWGPPWTADSSSYFESANRSKRSIELDLSDPSDQPFARELARRADVLVENFQAGHAGPAGPRATTRSARPTRASSTARSPASAPPAVPTCPATTSWCRPSAG